MLSSDTFQTQNYPLFIVEHPSLYTRLYAKVSASPFWGNGLRNSVITSATSAMPEIAGPEVFWSIPFEPEEIASALLHLEKMRNSISLNCIWIRKSPSVLMGEHSQRNIENI